VAADQHFDYRRHGDLNNFSPQTRVTMFPEERNFQNCGALIRSARGRAQVKYGVDVIKISPPAACFSKGDSPALRKLLRKS